MEKVVVTIRISYQISPDDWEVVSVSKSFEKTCTILDIEKWIKSKDKSHSISTAKINHLEE